MRNIAVNLLATIAFPLMLAAGPAAADDQPPPHHHRPPQQAFDACKDKKADDACQVTFREHTMTGKCAATPEGPLVCRPDHPPRHDEPPPAQP